MSATSEETERDAPVAPEYPVEPLQDWSSASAHATAHAEGQAALLLCEMLLYMLIDRGLLPKDGMVEALDVLLATKRQFAAEGSNVMTSRIAAGLLSSIQNSLRAE